MLAKFAQRLVDDPRLRHLVFFIASILTVLFVGYHFGTFDQTIHIVFLKKAANPALYPNNPFLDLRFQHYSYFWFLFQPFYNLGILEEILFIAHLAATYFTFWALWELSYTLFKNSLAALFTVVCFCWPHIGFAGFPVLEFSLLNRTFVLPGLLLAIIWFLRDRFILAFTLLGLLYNLHVISVQFVLAMFLFACIVEFRRIGWRNILMGLLGFLAAALPVLLWKLGSTPIDLSVHRDWFSAVSTGMLYSVFFMFTPYLQVWLMTASGLASLVLFWVAIRNRLHYPNDRTVSIFILACLFILMVEVVTAQWLPITIIIQSQIIRAGMFILIFGLVYFSWYVADGLQNHKENNDYFSLGVALVFSVFPIVPVLVLAYQRWIGNRRIQRWFTCSTIGVFFTLAFVVVLSYGIWLPGFHIYGPNTAWEDAQRWAREETPVDAIFITPPQIWGFVQSEWQVFSERSTVATQSELLEAAFAPEYLEYWQPRFESVAPGALAQFRGDYFANKSLTATSFYSLKTEDFSRLADRYGAQYLVVEKPHEYALPLVYENSGYRIYSLAH